jgi:exopolysaccharide biosynthesis WecB/TagA/CpsF family protein
MTTVARPEKVDVFGVGLSVTDYADATERIVAAGKAGESFGMSALATHGLMEAVHDESFMDVVNGLDMVTCDGQPVRWAMNILHKVGLTDRVYGPDLTWKVCGAAADAGVGIYLFGSTPETCDAFVAAIKEEWPHAIISDVQPDRFRDATPEEDEADVARMNASGWCSIRLPRRPAQEAAGTDAEVRPRMALAFGARTEAVVQAVCGDEHAICAGIGQGDRRPATRGLNPGLAPPIDVRTFDCAHGTH